MTREASDWIYSNETEKTGCVTQNQLDWSFSDKKYELVELPLVGQPSGAVFDWQNTSPALGAGVLTIERNEDHIMSA